MQVGKLFALSVNLSAGCLGCECKLLSASCLPEIMAIQSEGRRAGKRGKLKGLPPGQPHYSSIVMLCNTSTQLSLTHRLLYLGTCSQC